MKTLVSNVYVVTAERMPIRV